jgi:O-antigen/teichoic acid export membrane protein
MSNFPRFAKVFLDTFMTNVATTLIGFISGVVLARVLGPEGRGELALVVTSVTIMGLFQNICNGGNDILLGADNNRKQKLFLQSIIWILLLAALIMSSIAVLPDRFIIQFLGSSSASLSIMFIIYLVFFSADEGLKRLLSARQDFFYINRTNLAIPLIYMTLLIIFLFILGYGVFTVLVFLALQHMLKVLAYTWRLFTKFKDEGIGWIPERSLTSESIRVGSRALLVGLPTILLLRVDIWILNYYETSAVVGIYQVAVSFSTMILVIAGILNSIVTAKAVSEKGGEARALLISKLFFILSAVCYVPLLIFGEFIFVFLFGSEFRTSYFPAIYLWAAVIIWGFALPIGGHVVGKERYPMSAVIGMTLALGINITLNIILIPAFGAVGAAIASLIAYLFMAFAYMLIFYRLYNLSWRQFFWITKQEWEVLKRVGVPLNSH